MRLYMDWGEAWDLMFRSFIVFIGVGLIWLKFMDPIILCTVGLPVPILAGGLYFYWGWRKAKQRYFQDMEPEPEDSLEV
jgi:protein-S-isoprenylcysteine O-methyltransferase Ste14